MIASQEFRRYAVECRKMARSTRDKADKEQWMRLADRWILCAELAEHEIPGSERPRLPKRLPH